MFRNSLGWKMFTVVGFVLVIISSAWPLGGKPDPSIPLNVAMDDSASYAITSDDGMYTDSILNVRAEILSGNYFFDTNENKGDQGRRLNLYFPAGCTQCPASGPKDVYIATISSNFPADDLAALHSGQSWDKRFALNWAEGASSYVLRWNFPVDGTHGNVRFTCTAETNGTCATWVAAPTGTAGLYLKQYDRHGKLLGEVLVATVDMPFVMTLSRK